MEKGGGDGSKTGSVMKKSGSSIDASLILDFRDKEEHNIGVS